MSRQEGLYPFYITKKNDFKFSNSHLNPLNLSQILKILLDNATEVSFYIAALTYGTSYTTVFLQQTTLVRF